MKKLFGLLMLLPFFAVAQKVITHTVGPKESLSSIGRMYNINGRELANYNKIDYDKGLTIGQVLKVPVKDGVAITPGKKEPEKPVTPVKEIPAVKTPAAKENGQPIYHTVAKKETLYHISTIYNKVPVADIKKWNNLTSDALSEGAQIIVGYTAAKPAAAVTKTPVENKKPVEVVEVPKPKKEDAAAKNTAPVQEPAVVKTVPEVTVPAKTTTMIEIPAKAADFKGGVFKNVYEEQVKNKSVVTENGTGGVFKSTSGWEDGKYYCLHNNAAAGTILKITNTATGKTVYAKVLDLITDIKQNNGLIIRISNAAADALGVTDNKLDCTINYSK